MVFLLEVADDVVVGLDAFVGTGHDGLDRSGQTALLEGCFVFVPDVVLAAFDLVDDALVIADDGVLEVEEHPVTGGEDADAVLGFSAQAPNFILKLVGQLMALGRAVIEHGLESRIPGLLRGGAIPFGAVQGGRDQAVEHVNLSFVDAGHC
jgi:hypothetical protein